MKRNNNEYSVIFYINNPISILNEELTGEVLATQFKNRVLNTQSTHLKLALIGSRNFSDHELIKEFVDNLNIDDLQIISGGAAGADYIAKTVALTNKLKYIEFNPEHTPHNQYSYHPKDHYSKGYHSGNYLSRNREIVNYSDVVVAFMDRDSDNKGTTYTVEYAKKNKKPVIVVY